AGVQQRFSVGRPIVRSHRFRRLVEQSFRAVEARRALVQTVIVRSGRSIHDPLRIVRPDRGKVGSAVEREPSGLTAGEIEYEYVAVIQDSPIDHQTTSVSR